MKPILLFITLFTSLFSLSQNPRPLAHEMVRNNVNTALIWSDGTIDDNPIWSPDSKKIAINILGTWMEFDLDEVFLDKADWRDMVIGLNITETFEILPKSKIESYRKSTNYGARKVVTKDSSIILELRMQGLSTAFYVNDKLMWQTGGDNCHSMAISNDEKYMAFISEANGLMIYALDTETLKKEIPKPALKCNEVIEFLMQENPNKATKTLIKTIKSYPSYSETYAWLAFLEMTYESKKQALEWINIAIEKNPNVSNYHFLKYILYLGEEDFENAEKSIKKFIELKPNCLFGYFELAELYVILENTSGACENYELAKKYGSNRAIEKIKEHCVN